MLPTSHYVTVQQVADYFSCHERTIIRMIEDGQLHAIRLREGKRPMFRVLRSSVEDLERERNAAS